MSKERVSFDSHGGWSKDGQLRDMDVKRAEAKGEPTAEAVEAQPKAVPTPAPAPKMGGFSLENLRKQTGVGTQTTSPTPAETPTEEKPASPEVEEQSSLEAAVNEALGDYAQQAADEATEHEVYSDLVAQVSSAPDVPEEQKAEEVVPPKAEFSLSQLGLSTEKKEKDAEVKVPAAESALDTPAPVGEKMELQTGNKAAPAPVEEKPKAPVEHFNIVPAAKLLSEPYGAASLEEAPEEVKVWLLRVGKEFVKHPSSIFTSRNFPNLRAYALFYPSGRKGSACIGLGKGADFTAVTYNQNKGVLVDMSRNLAISGMCVMAGSSPLAITTLIESTRTVEL